jgi:signal recognition particle receptor subunit beta
MNFLKKIKSFFRKKKQPKKVPTLKKAVKQNTKHNPHPQEPIKSKDRAKIEQSHKPTKKTGKKNKRKQQTRSSTDPIHKHAANLPAQIKVVITGSVGAGKTTAIHAVSEKPPITTETAPSDTVKEIKNTTTTSMDYGSYTNSDSKIHVYGTPGQQRFSFMSAVLTKGACGLIILITNNQDKPLEDLDHYLTNNKEFLSKKPAVVGITHLDVNSSHDISIYSDFMEKQGINWPVIPVDARKSADVLNLINHVTQAAFSPKFH